MEEKIIGLLKSWESCPFAGHDWISAISGSNYPDLAKEITALFSDWYPAEFVEWLFVNSKQYTINEAYQFWQTEIKDKG
jgi:hypothetical protein